MRETLWGLVGSSSAISMVAERDPCARGVNVIVMVQLLSAGTLLPQVLVWVKSLGSAPVKVTPVMLSAFPKFWSVTAWDGSGVPHRLGGKRNV